MLLIVSISTSRSTRSIFFLVRDAPCGGLHNVIVLASHLHLRACAGTGRRNLEPARLLRPARYLAMPASPSTVIAGSG